METTRVRLADPADAAPILAIYTPIVRDTFISFELEPPTEAEMARRIETRTAVFPWLVTEGEQGVLGYAYAGPFRNRPAYQWAVDVSVYVAPTRQRRGLGRRLYQTLFAILRAQGYYTAVAVIALPNPASIGLHEALGFRPVGIFHNVGYKLGAWRDTGWWTLALRPPDEAPLPPRPLPALRDSGELERLLVER